MIKASKRCQVTCQGSDGTIEWFEPIPVWTYLQILNAEILRFSTLASFLRKDRNSGILGIPRFEINDKSM